MREMTVLSSGNLRDFCSLTEKPRAVKLLAIFYGLQGFLLLSIFVFFLASSLLHTGSGPPIGGAGVAILLIFGVSSGGALLYLSVARGLLLGRNWARTLGIIISILALLYFVPAMILSARAGLESLLSNWMVLLVGGIPTFLNGASVYCFTRREVRAHFKHEVHAKERIQEGIYVKRDEPTPEENALLIRYQREYPHNPEGALEFHISRKMKEGKTREQAVGELAKENE